MKKLALVLVILLAAAGLWWWESPRLATENLLDAAHDNDIAELEQLVDADAFAASVRAELPARAPLPLPSPSAGAAEPERGDRLVAGLAGDAELIQLRQAARTSWEIDHRGLDSFRVVRRSGDGKPLPGLLFKRDGLHWKLAGVDAPSE